AATGQRSRTRPSSTIVSRSARLIVGHTWFGTITIRSPTRTSASGGTSSTPCSSLSRTTSQSSWPHTRPNDSGGSPTSIRSDVSTFVPESTTSRSGTGRPTTVATTNAATSSSVQAPCAIWLRSLKTYVPGRTSVTPTQWIAKRKVPAEPTETVFTASP